MLKNNFIAQELKCFSIFVENIKTNIMNTYLTDNQEDTIYTQIMNIFESKKGECTNCESNYIFDTRNYFEMMTEENTFRVEFNTKKGKLLKRSVNIKKL